MVARGVRAALTRDGARSVAVGARLILIAGLVIRVRRDGNRVGALEPAAKIDVNEEYVQLLGQWGMLIMSFYFGGRTLEKIIGMKDKKDVK